jgi:hypothetical protein
MAAANKKIQNEVSSNHEESSVALHLSDVDARIAECAYYKAENRDFAPGHEIDDWLEAEREFRA